MEATHPAETRERVLICEDETIIRLDLRQLLEGAGYEVVAEARDGEEAVELALEHEPDLAIMDVKMPRLDGIEAARRIIAERPIPIVILTAHSHEGLVARAVQAGVGGYVVKPFREADLLPAIATARARHEELQALRLRAEAPATAAAGGLGAQSGAGAVLDLVRSGRAPTRAELARLTGLSRSTISQRLDELVARGYIVRGGAAGSTGGRPSRTFVFNSGGGVLLAADVGISRMRVALTDLSAVVLAEQICDPVANETPARVLGFVRDRFDELLAAARRNRDEVRGIGLGVPDPVEFEAGGTAASRFADFPGIPVLVDREDNVVALGEHRRHWPDAGHMLFVNVGERISCAMIVDGAVYRGAQGVAGEIGDARTSRDVLALVRQAEVDAPLLARQAGRLLGEASSAAVNLFNPSLLVIGGDVGHDEQFLAGVRELVYQRSMPLATRDLRIVFSRLDEDAGVTGAATLVSEHLFAPAAVERALAAGA